MEEVVNHHLLWLLTAGGSGKSSSCPPLPRKRKMLNKQPWKHPPPLLTEAPPLLFLRLVTGTGTNVSAALCLQETPSHTPSCMWSPSPKRTAEQRFPLLVLCNFVWLLILDVVFPIAHQWKLLSRAFTYTLSMKGWFIISSAAFLPGFSDFTLFLSKIILRDVF